MGGTGGRESNSKHIGTSRAVSPLSARRREDTTDIAG